MLRLILPKERLCCMSRTGGWLMLTSPVGISITTLAPSHLFHLILPPQPAGLQVQCETTSFPLATIPLSPSIKAFCRDRLTPAVHHNSQFQSGLCRRQFLIVKFLNPAFPLFRFLLKYTAAGIAHNMLG